MNVAKPRRRLPCEFCERKFSDHPSLALHVKRMHKKAAKLVAELRQPKKEPDMRVEKEVLHQLARRLNPNNTRPEALGDAMALKVADLARNLMEMTAEKNDGFVEISLA